ncbi:MAG: thiolase family protein [Gammaproteobacteria bacterium]|nr:thiolase family protein [Gammaproteobacteria bacterium]
MEDVYLVGVSMTPFGKFLDKSVKDLTHEAVAAALADAGLTPADVGAAWFANTTQGVMEGQYCVPGQIALREMGFEGIPMTNVENACASASTAFNAAATAIRAGVSEIALAVGVDKMYDQDKARSFAIFDGALDVHRRTETFEQLLALGEGVEEPADEAAGNQQRSPFMDVYACFARQHMQRFGLTQRQLAAVASKNHAHSALNPRSQFRFEASVDEVLAARRIAWPLTLPMCSPISDGGAAAVLCAASALDRFDSKRAVKVLASVMGTGVNRSPEELDKHITRRAALRAYEQAGIGPADVDVAEVHDATAMGEVTQTENLGFCEFGEGGRLAERGETRIGGRIPVNPSGGLESKGHPIGATGLGQIFELATQLRGESGERQVEGARLAIAENGGGILGIEEATCCITILGRN